MKKLSKFVGLTLAMSLAAAPLAACADDNVFLIGGCGPLTGANASYGNSVMNGAQIAIDEINAAGGVQVGDTTYTLDLAFEDDEATEDKAVQAYNTLMDQGIDGFLGAVTSGACIAVVSISQQDGILQITPSGSAEACINGDNAFRICFSDPEQGTAMAGYFRELEDVIGGVHLKDGEGTMLSGSLLGVCNNEQRKKTGRSHGSGPNPGTKEETPCEND